LVSFRTCYTLAGLEASVAAQTVEYWIRHVSQTQFVVVRDKSRNRPGSASTSSYREPRYTGPTAGNKQVCYCQRYGDTEFHANAQSLRASFVRGVCSHVMVAQKLKLMDELDSDRH
jgi:hypothetical protein